MKISKLNPLLAPLLLALIVMIALSGCGRDQPHSASSPAEPPPVQGTESSAGGGNAVVCFADSTIPNLIRTENGVLKDQWLSQIQSIEMLDLFEARKPRAGTNEPTAITAIDETKPLENYISTIALNSTEIIPILFDLIQEGAKHFPSSVTRFPEMQGLRKINDANLTDPLPSACVLVTMAAQRGKGGVGDLALDSRLFFHKKHSYLSQAVLLLHEYLYVVARTNGHTDSRGVRALVGQLIAQKPDANIAEWIRLTDELRPAHAPPSPDEVTSCLIATADDLMDRLHFFISYHQAAHEALLQESERHLNDRGLHCEVANAGGCLNSLASLNDGLSKKLQLKLKQAILEEDAELERIVRQRWREDQVRYFDGAREGYFMHNWLSKPTSRKLDLFVEQVLLPEIARTIQHPFCDEDGTNCVWVYFDRTQTPRFLAQLLARESLSFAKEKIQ